MAQEQGARRHRTAARDPRGGRPTTTRSCPPPRQRQRLDERRAAASGSDGPDGDSFSDVVCWLDVLVREDGGLMQVDALAARLVLLAEEHHAGGLCPTKTFGGLGMVLRRTAADDAVQSPLLVSAAAREVISRSCFGHGPR